MPHNKLLLLVLLLLCFRPCLLVAETPAMSPGAQSAKALAPDTLLFTNGDQLTGTFLQSTGATLTFHSDVAGDVEVNWSKVKDLRSLRAFVVLNKQQHLNRRTLSTVPSGTLSVDGGKVEIVSGGVTVHTPIPQIAAVVEQRIFAAKALHREPFLSGWDGALSFGASAVQATQDNQTVYGSANLSRNSPAVSYLPRLDRTTFNASGSYSRSTQRQAPLAPVLPDVNISIYHADGEQDRYVSSRFFLLGQTAFDHNVSQGLILQQVYGAGAGWTVLDNPRQKLDLRATLQYEKQQFVYSTALRNDTDLVGSTLSVEYHLQLPMHIVFNQQAQYLPAYNETRAYSASETNTLTLPLSRRLRLTVGSTDNYLNDPPDVIYPAPLNRQNSLQTNVGLSFSLH